MEICLAFKLFSTESNSRKMRFLKADSSMYDVINILTHFCYVGVWMYFVAETYFKRQKKAKNTTNINKLTFILFVRVDGQVVGVMISAAPRSRPGWTFSQRANRKTKGNQIPCWTTLAKNMFRCCKSTNHLISLLLYSTECHKYSRNNVCVCVCERQSEGENVCTTGCHAKHKIMGLCSVHEGTYYQNLTPCRYS